MANAAQPRDHAKMSEERNHEQVVGTFMLDGCYYDFSAEEAPEIRRIFARYIAHARVKKTRAA